MSVLIPLYFVVGTLLILACVARMVVLVVRADRATDAERTRGFEVIAKRKGY